MLRPVANKRDTKKMGLEMGHMKEDEGGMRRTNLKTFQHNTAIKTRPVVCPTRRIKDSGSHATDHKSQIQKIPPIDYTRIAYRQSADRLSVTGSSPQFVCLFFEAI